MVRFDKRLSKTSRPRLLYRIIFLIGLATILIAWTGALLRVVSISNTRNTTDSISRNPFSKAIIAVNNVDEKYDSVTREIPGLEIAITMPSADGQSDLQVVLPSNLPSYFSSNKLNPRGMVLLLHACTHSAFKFFSPSISTCSNCVGLSEELRIVRLVLEKGYIPVALSSVDRKSGCWNPLKDSKRIEYLLNWLKQTDETSKAPVQVSLRKFIGTVLSSTTTSNIYVIGASSGGTMAAHLVAHGIMDAGVVMVMALGPKVVSQLKELHRQQEETDHGGKRSKLYLAPMPRDKGTTRKATQNYQALCTDCPTTMNNPSKSDWIVLDTTRCSSLPVTVGFLVQRVPGMNVEAAAMLVEVLREANHIDKDTQQLIVDPTRSNWRDLLLQKENRMGGVSSSSNAFYYHGKFALQPGYSPLAKALHRAWAFHEYCSEVVIPALEFFEKREIME